jgi:hypothetical protein
MPLKVRELQWLNALRDENVVAGMQLYVADCPNNKKRHRPSAGETSLSAGPMRVLKGGCGGGAFWTDAPWVRQG